MKQSVMLLAAAIAGASALKVAVLSDFHLDLQYNSTASSKTKCRVSDSNSTSYAPLGRFGCDSPQILAQYMLQKVLDQEGTPDLVLVSGDHVAHGVAIKPNSDDGSYENPLQMETIQTVTDMLAEFFPDTLVLPVFGNNDCYYHSMAPFTSEKDQYYQDIYDMWFQELPENAKLPELNTIEETFLYGGYYRVDISDELSVLALNTMYFSIDNDTSQTPLEGTTMLDWMEDQLKNAEADRKFILTSHIYGGARYEGETLWHDSFTSSYFSTLLKYHDKVMIEVSGHDHYADLRYHSSQGMPSDLDIDDADDKFDFHNQIVAPGITPNKDQQPGFAVFDIINNVPQNLRMTFLDLMKYIGSDWSQAPSYNDVEWLYADFASKYGLKNLDAKSFADLRKFLDDDKDTFISYLVTKLGFDENDKDEYDAAIDLLADKDFITSSKHKTDEASCLMHQNFSQDEYEDCTGKKYLMSLIEEESINMFLQ